MVQSEYECPHYDNCVNVKLQTCPPSSVNADAPCEFLIFFVKIPISILTFIDSRFEYFFLTPSSGLDLSKHCSVNKQTNCTYEFIAAVIVQSWKLLTNFHQKVDMNTV